MSPTSKPNEIRLIRVYDAPVEIVWDAWTDPDQAAQWWGPRGFTLTTHSKDLRPGGIWHYTMHGPDGTDYPNKTLYHEVEEQKKLVYDHGANDERAPLFRVTVTFAESGGKTTMDMTMALRTAEEAQATREFIKKAGGNGTWDRLAEYLDKQIAGRDVFVINRSFDAPVDVLFTMWTDPERLAKWLPPVGLDMEFREVDIRAGGSAFYKMTDHADVTMYGRIEYKEIVEPSRLVYTQQFCDREGNISRPPMVPVWPATMHTKVLLTAEGSNSSRVTVTWKPVGEFTPDELAAFLEHRPSMTQGWTGSFDKLEALLEAKS